MPFLGCEEILSREMVINDIMKMVVKGLMFCTNRWTLTEARFVFVGSVVNFPSGCYLSVSVRGLFEQTAICFSGNLSIWYLKRLVKSPW